MGVYICTSDKLMSISYEILHISRWTTFCSAAVNGFSSTSSSLAGAVCSWWVWNGFLSGLEFILYPKIVFTIFLVASITCALLIPRQETSSSVSLPLRKQRWSWRMQSVLRSLIYMFLLGLQRSAIASRGGGGADLRGIPWRGDFGFSWDIIDYRRAPNHRSCGGAQASELRFYADLEGTILISPMGATITGTGGGSRETPQNLFDGTVNTKMCCRITNVKILFPSAVRARSYRYVTANDVPCRDPAQWTMQNLDESGSYSNDDDHVSDIVSDTVALGRRTRTRAFPLSHAPALRPMPPVYGVKWIIDDYNTVCTRSQLGGNLDPAFFYGHASELRFYSDRQGSAQVFVPSSAVVTGSGNINGAEHLTNLFDNNLNTKTCCRFDFVQVTFTTPITFNSYKYGTAYDFQCRDPNR